MSHMGPSEGENANANTWPDQWPDKLDDPLDPGWAGSWNGYFGKDQKNAEQESYFVMDDAQDAEFFYFPDSNDLERRGMGLRCTQRGLQWNHILAEDVLFWLYDIKNISDYDLEKMKLSSKNFGKLINLVSENQINKNSGKEILAKIYTTDEDPIELVDKMGLKSMDNKDELVNMVNDVLKDNNSAIEDYRKGKENAVRFLIGQVMKKSRGTANPSDTEEEIIRQLNEK